MDYPLSIEIQLLQPGYQPAKFAQHALFQSSDAISLKIIVKHPVEV